MDELDIGFAALSLGKVVVDFYTAEGVCEEIHNILDTQFKKMLPRDEFAGVKLLYYSLHKLTGFKHDSLSVSHADNLLCIDMWITPGAHMIDGAVIYDDINDRLIWLSLLSGEAPVHVTLRKALDMFGRQNVSVTLSAVTVQRAVEVLETLLACVYSAELE
jgi:hypothetical protein